MTLWKRSSKRPSSAAPRWLGRLTSRVGDKVTKRGWEEIAAGTYVAQALVKPSERLIAGAQDPAALKLDVRNYAYAASVKLVAARLYQRQTTNFRAPGEGFPPVLTSRDV